MGKFNFKLSFVIVSMVMLTVLVTSSISIWFSYQSFNDMLIQPKLIMQEEYMGKVSEIAEHNVQGVKGIMKNSEKEMVADGDFKKAVNQEDILSIKVFLKKILFPLLVMLVIVFIVVWWFALKITRPLREMTKSGQEAYGVSNLKSVDVWYAEASNLKNVLLTSICDSQSKIEELTDQLKLDSLTGIPNRRSMDQVLNKLIAEKVPHAILLIDLDDFKIVNDTYGHTVGDEVLKAFAIQMEEIVQRQGSCFRYGGEEFLVVLPHTAIDDAIKVAEELRLKQAFAENPSGRPVTLSAGITVFTSYISDPNQLIAIADQALYEAKQSGRNCIRVVDASLVVN
ncbi:GGDEF domain-containing protein [Lysinibacillus sp. NPDC097195]|uniref:GGDEF domain-containing protein n=1 Tax=Lysinibacillus sp. NPDC097195 TaxID=3364141 RepID=UPI0037FBE395